MPEDGGEDVVEVVGDAAGQDADGLHFLGLEQVLLELLLFRDIAVERLDIGRIADGDGLGADFEVNGGPVAFVVAGFKHQRFAVQDPAHPFGHLVPVAGVLQQPDVGADERFPREAVHLAGPLICVHDDAAPVEDDDAVGRVLEQRPVPLLRLVQLLRPLLDHAFELRGVGLELQLVLGEVVLQGEVLHVQFIIHVPPQEASAYGGREKYAVIDENARIGDRIERQNGNYVNGIDYSRQHKRQPQGNGEQPEEKDIHDHQTRIVGGLMAAEGENHQFDHR